MTRLSLVASALLLFARVAIADDPPKVTEEDAKAKVAALDAAMKGESADEKNAAITACGQTPHALTAAALGPLLTNASEDIRKNAATALGQMKGLSEAAKALQGGMSGNEDKPEVLTLIFTSLSSVSHVSTVAVVQGWLDKKLKKADSAKLPAVDAGIECLANHKFKKTVDALIALLKTSEAAGPKLPKGACAPGDSRVSAALNRLTGKSFPSSTDWTTWWKKSEGTLNDDLTPKKK